MTRATPLGDHPSFRAWSGACGSCAAAARATRAAPSSSCRAATIWSAASWASLLGPPVHAGYRLYSAAGVDAGVVGNHDLDAGAGPLARAIERDARFPLLSANLCASPPLAGRVHPAALLVVKGLRIGLVGLTTRGEIRCAPDLCLSHPLLALQNLLPALRPLCDVLIVLSHLGHSLAASSATTRDVGDVELAASLPPGSVHLIVGGHTHEALNETCLSAANLVNGIPIVQAGTMGRCLGEVDITVGEQGLRHRRAPDAHRRPAAGRGL